MLFVLVYIVATLFAVDPRVSIEALWEVGIHSVMVLAAVDMMRIYKPRRVIEALLFSSAVVGPEIVEIEGDQFPARPALSQSL